jgi:hypothetical protein
LVNALMRVTLLVLFIIRSNHEIYEGDDLSVARIGSFVYGLPNRREGRSPWNGANPTESVDRGVFQFKKRRKDHGHHSHHGDEHSDKQGDRV